MKTISLITMIITSFGLSAQTQTEVTAKSEFGLLHCQQVKTINFTDGEKYCDVVVSFRNMDWYVDTAEVVLTNTDILDQFKRELKLCIDYIELKQKDKTKLVYTNSHYSLVIHDFPNRIYLYDPSMGYTVMTMREAHALLVWLNGLS